jgi:hypothetical protein
MLKVDGFWTLNENMADNGGIRAAFRAFQQVLLENPAEAKKRVRGLEHFSPEQLFFASYVFVRYPYFYLKKYVPFIFRRGAITCPIAIRFCVEDGTWTDTRPPTPGSTTSSRTCPSSLRPLAVIPAEGQQQVPQYERVRRSGSCLSASDS